MLEETGTTPEAETEVEAPEVQDDAAEPVENETDAAADEPELDADGNIVEPVEEEAEEVEYSGKKYKLPKELLPIIQKAENLEAGYTKKYQDVAELRKQAEAEIASVRKEHSLIQEISKESADLRAVETRLAQYETVDWQAWQASNPAAANAAMGELFQLQAVHGKLRGAVEARIHEVNTINEQRAATVIAQAVEALSKPDPERGWHGKFDETAKASLSKFGKELGYTDAELAGTTHPLMIKTLNLAKIGYEALKAQRAKAAPVKKVAAPVPTVQTSKTKSQVNPDRLSDADWVKWRNAQTKAKRK